MVSLRSRQRKALLHPGDRADIVRRFRGWRLDLLAEYGSPVGAPDLVAAEGIVGEADDLAINHLRWVSRPKGDSGSHV